MGTSLTGNPVVSIATHEHSSSAASCTQEASFASAGADLPMIWLVTIEKPHCVDERYDCASAPVGILDRQRRPSEARRRGSCAISPNTPSALPPQKAAPSAAGSSASSGIIPGERRFAPGNVSIASGRAANAIADGCFGLRRRKHQSPDPLRSAILYREAAR
jgi:hypothetical protein